MPVIERGHHLKRFGEQHSVAEHIARHIAAANNTNRVFLNVNSAFGKVALHRNPRALGRNPHRLMIITNRATAREGIAKPEAAFKRDGVGHIGECRSALVSRDHEIGVFAVMDHNAVRMNNFALDDIIRDRKQSTNENAVTFGALGKPSLTVRRARQCLGVEAPLCPGWHDHSVLNPLRLHQSENFGAEIIASIRPAQPTTRDWPSS